MSQHSPAKVFVYMDPDLRSAIERAQRLDKRFRNRSDLYRHLLRLGLRAYREANTSQARRPRKRDA